MHSSSPDRAGGFVPQGAKRELTVLSWPLRLSLFLCPAAGLRSRNGLMSSVINSLPNGGGRTAPRIVLPLKWGADSFPSGNVQMFFSCGRARLCPGFDTARVDYRGSVVSPAWAAWLPRVVADTRNHGVGLPSGFLENGLGLDDIREGADRPWHTSSPMSPSRRPWGVEPHAMSETQ